MSPATARAGHGRTGRRPLALTTPDRAHFASFPKGDSTRWLLCPLWSPAWPPCGRQGFEKLQTPAADKSTQPECPQPDHPRGQLTSPLQSGHLSIGGCGTWSPHQRVTHRPTPSEGGDVNCRAGVGPIAPRGQLTSPLQMQSSQLLPAVRPARGRLVQPGEPATTREETPSGGATSLPLAHAECPGVTIWWPAASFLGRCPSARGGVHTCIHTYVHSYACTYVGTYICT